jgi:hypothetical protein
VCSIAAPLLLVTTALEDAGVPQQLFGSVPDVIVLGVFGHASRTDAARSRAGSEPVIDLRSTSGATVEGEGSEAVTTVSLGRVPGERTGTREIAAQIAEVIEHIGASTVAMSLGLGGADHLEASDAALLARRRTRRRVRWIVYSDGDPATDAGRVARRRMLLLVRGIRLEPVVVAEAPMGSTVRYWEIRAADR